MDDFHWMSKSILQLHDRMMVEYIYWMYHIFEKSFWYFLRPESCLLLFSSISWVIETDLN